MCTLRDVVVFLAGAQFLHTLIHVVFRYILVFPLTIPMHNQIFELTSSLNNMAIVVNTVITVGLLLWAMWLGKRSPRA